jgi:hypothetical protein
VEGLTDAKFIMTVGMPLEMGGIYWTLHCELLKNYRRSDSGNDACLCQSKSATEDLISFHYLDIRVIIRLILLVCFMF